LVSLPSLLVLRFLARLDASSQFDCPSRTNADLCSSSPPSHSLSSLEKGPTPNSHRYRQALPEEARRISGDRAKGSPDGDEGLRLARRPRSSLCLLETSLDGPCCCQGQFKTIFPSSLLRLRRRADDRASFFIHPRPSFSPTDLPFPFPRRASLRRSLRSFLERSQLSPVCTTSQQR